MGRVASRIPKFLVIGHRGNGMNALQSSDRRMRAIKENSIASFNSAANFPIDFVEFDVQVRELPCLLLFPLFLSVSQFNSMNSTQQCLCVSGFFGGLFLFFTCYLFIFTHANCRNLNSTVLAVCRRIRVVGVGMRVRMRMNLIESAVKPAPV